MASKFFIAGHVSSLSSSIHMRKIHQGQDSEELEHYRSKFRRGRQQSVCYIWIFREYTPSVLQVYFMCLYRNALAMTRREWVMRQDVLSRISLTIRSRSATA